MSPFLRRIAPGLLLATVALGITLSSRPGKAAPRLLSASDFRGLEDSAIQVKTGEWYYEPKEIGVEASTMVSLTLQHVGSTTIPHDIVFELDGGRKAASNKIRGGETDALGFVAPAEPGEYVFYCSVGNHRSRGMEGKLVVTGPGGVVPTPAATSTTMGPEPTATPLPPTEPPGTDRWSINLPMLFKE